MGYRDKFYAMIILRENFGKYAVINSVCKIGDPGYIIIPMTDQNKSLFQIIHLLSDIMVFQSYEFDKFLKKLIKLIITIVPVDSCLIYFFDREKKEAVLVGSKKSHQKLLGKISLKKGEGITGWVAEHQKPVVLKKAAYKDKRFKTFSELPEDTFEAFLSVPIQDRTGTIGVVNLQHKQPYAFTQSQIKSIEAVGKIIASAFEKVNLERKVDNLEQKLEERKVIEKAKGTLMDKKGLSEKDAYALIRKEAMKKRKTMREIADAVLLVYE